MLAEPSLSRMMPSLVVARRWRSPNTILPQPNQHCSLSRRHPKGCNASTQESDYQHLCPAVIFPQLRKCEYAGRTSKSSSSLNPGSCPQHGASPCPHVSTLLVAVVVIVVRRPDRGAVRLQLGLYARSACVRSVCLHAQQVLNCVPFLRFESRWLS